MFFLPVTLIVTLLASLVVAYLINPVFAVQFMKPHQDDNDPLVKAKKNKGLKITGVVFAAVALLFYISGNFGMGNFILFLYGLILLNRFVYQGNIEFSN